MSANRSWDIQPNRKPAQPVRPQSQVRVVARPKPTRREAVRRPAPTAPRAPLRQQRKAARKRLLLILLTVAFVILAAVITLLWQSFLRVQTVITDAPNGEEVQAFTLQELSGTRFLILPNNSIFILPEQRLRERLLEHFPGMQAVSISPSGLTQLSVHAIMRAAVMRWCGATPADVAETCYDTDTAGLIFREVPLEERYATTSLLTLYAPLTGTSTLPLGAHIEEAGAVSGLLQFVKAMRSLGADITSVALRGDEADLYTRSNTRVTYVLGREQDAAKLAASGFSSLNLNDGSLLYVDLRFTDKVFFKKKGE